jgi:hypothetical protein
MTGCVRIEPTGIYDDGALYHALEVGSTTLARARRAGKLRFTKKGNRILYLGAWVLEWLQLAEDKEAVHAS